MLNAWRSSTKFFNSLYFARSFEWDTFWKTDTKKSWRGNLCTSTIERSAFYRYIFLVKKKKDDTEKRGWKTETCKIDAWDEVFEINCATFRISTQREREWGKYWMCTDSFEHLKCCLLFFQQFLFDSIEKRKQKKINIHIHQKKLLHSEKLCKFTYELMNKLSRFFPNTLV